MEHISFVLKIDPERAEEYLQRHAQVDPELEAQFAQVGIERYHIFFHQDGTLFAYMQVQNFEYAMNALQNHPANVRWQQYMSDMLLLWEHGETVQRIPEMYRYVKQPS